MKSRIKKRALHFKNKDTFLVQMEFTSKDEISSADLVKTLEKNVMLLKVENLHNSRICYELEFKLEWFNNISRGLADKLDSLWNLAEAHHPIGNEIQCFVNQIWSSWSHLNKQIYEEYSKIRVGSRTVYGIPLSLLLDKVRKKVALIKVSLKIHEAVYSYECVSKSYHLIVEIEQLLSGLERCDSKLHQFLSVSKITPQLIKLESAVDEYVSNMQLLSIKKSPSSDLSAFFVVIKLLTGELLDQERIDPNHVLAENAPKKPVFIIKNVKRKMDVTILPDVKMFKNSK